MRLEGRVCAVTGGGSGIGAAICSTFAREGARVAVLDIDLAAAERVASECRWAGAFVCDVADAASVEAAIDRTVDRFGALDILVNNAGILGKEEYGRVQRLREQQAQDVGLGRPARPLRATVSLTDEQWRRMIDTHLTGTFYCSRAAIRRMEEQGRGVIINMASIAGLDGGNGNPHYAAAKAGILGFTRGVAKEVIAQGIRVNAIAPGFVETPLRDAISPETQRRQVAATPIGRAAYADEIAKTALFLASDDASYVVGATLDVNGGYLTI